MACAALGRNAYIEDLERLHSLREAINVSLPVELLKCAASVLAVRLIPFPFQSPLIPSLFQSF